MSKMFVQFYVGLSSEQLHKWRGDSVSQEVKNATSLEEHNTLSKHFYVN